MKEVLRSEIEKRIDILEDDIASIDKSVLRILLKDKTTKKNILWCTRDYEDLGVQYDERAEIKVELITGRHYNVIQPRAAKSKAVQEQRIRKRAEVFTPSWICNEQNNQIDETWFNRANVFNTPSDNTWIVNKKKISFTKKKTWESYVDDRRLEISCGEAPYLVSRYDTTTGELIPTNERIGLFDRKMRVVGENCKEDSKWLDWSLRALKSIYGYEFQGDSVLIARENLLYDYMDYYRARFDEAVPVPILKEVADIIAWNIWQMDGLKGVVPYSCTEVKEKYHQMSLFDTADEAASSPCPGCERNDIFSHTGIYCRIYDWKDLNKSILFVDMLKEGENRGEI